MPGGTLTAMTDQQTAVLTFEERRYKWAGAKEAAIRDELGMSATRYHQVLNAAIDHPDAMAGWPVLVKRLRRLREARRAARAACVDVLT